MARDGTVPPLAFQALIYPAVDLTAASNSYQTMTAGIPLTAATMHYFIDHYTPEVKDRLDWHASPIKASSLAGTPPALVVTVSNDPLCDEGLAYARRLEEEGVKFQGDHADPTKRISYEDIRARLRLAGVAVPADPEV